MPRPTKWRRICNMPKINTFGPYAEEKSEEIIQITLEEFETIRLIDYKGLSQTECGEVMGVARSTIQRIYENARKKIADSMVNGKVIKIQGGNYKLCNENKEEKMCGRCNRRRGRNQKLNK